MRTLLQDRTGFEPRTFTLKCIQVYHYEKRNEFGKIGSRSMTNLNLKMGSLSIRIYGHFDVGLIFAARAK